VSHELQLIYFETPKCGCSSIKAALDIGFHTDPTQFAMAYIIQSQRYCSERDSMNGTLTTTYRRFAACVTTPEALHDASLLAASRLSEGEYCSNPIGRFEFMHFFASPEYAISQFPSYRKFIVVRNPFDRVASAWNMFYSKRGSLEERVMQCEQSLEEKKSLRHFVGNLWTYPNHHFDRIENFVSSDILLKNVDIVPFNNLGLYWENLRTKHNLPPLGHANAGGGYLSADFSESDALKNEQFSEYYFKDYELIKLAAS